MNPQDYKTGDAAPGASVHGIRGRRPSMEDETFYATWYVGLENPTIPVSHKKVTVYGVMDGHGGAHASKFAKKWLPWMLAHYVDPTATVTYQKKQITESFLRIQNFMRQYSDYHRGVFEHQGTTVSMFLLTHNRLFCINAGDSRCVLCRGTRATPLSHDHKPTDPSEQRRIYSLGGAVSENRGDVPRVEPIGLATSRSLGDLDSRHRVDGQTLPPGTYLVSPIPDISVMPRSRIADTDVAILACDGLWDVTGNTNACRVASHVGVEKAARTLVATAYRDGSTDNISVMVVPMGEPAEISAEGIYYSKRLGAAVINPLTGRPIKYMGPTHQRLLEALRG